MFEPKPLSPHCTPAPRCRRCRLPVVRVHPQDRLQTAVTTDELLSRIESWVCRDTKRCAARATLRLVVAAA